VRCIPEEGRTTGTGHRFVTDPHETNCKFEHGRWLQRVCDAGLARYGEV
jgi:hypothetical protein